MQMNLKGKAWGSHVTLKSRIEQVGNLLSVHYLNHCLIDKNLRATST